jgi:transposase InsO family protein
MTEAGTGHTAQDRLQDLRPLKREATKPAAANVLQQQARFDDFVTRYNTDRPHQALGMKVPADLYARSPGCIAASRS